ncbi:DUF2126 domain-containing protein [Chrysiogenes arsenatis]|uniref:transglutaminase family protein n=1 Tax=Chrysiogenes arsenatis TaxID=309797 RepID=UPI0004218C1B|nr:transglutaminase family protein [Chrysiogenes arsenatis]
MTISVAIHHRTVYKFDRLVSLSPHIFRLRPAVHSRTPIKGYSLRITPEKHFINWQQDPFGNFLARVVFPEKTRELTVEVEVLADMTVINPFDFFAEEYAETFPFTYKEQLKKELIPYMEVTERGPLLLKWLKQIDTSEPLRSVDFLVKVNSLISQHIGYSIRMEPGVQTAEETLASRVGSCRDSAWLLVQILRHLGLAARFVSGYLVQLTADVKSLDGPSGPEKDFTDLHAWTEVYLPGAGWIGLDPTSGLFAGEGHIPLAGTPDPISAAPVTGMTDKCETEFEFENRVTRIHEDPRTTKPYTDEQWEAVKALGYKVDEVLDANDVRLTMGGEPTFISVDDMEAPEWNTAADGPQKRALAQDLILRLREAFGAGGVLQYGQGKWYPGEPLPRWQYGCFWRKDRQPVWRNPKLLASPAVDYKHGIEHAEQFIQSLADHLGIAKNFTQPAYEDTWYHLWKEKNLPVNVDPLKVNLKDDLERQQLAKLLERGLDVPTGYVIPLAWDYQRTGWRSCRWEFRRKNLFLLPGTSPMGFRLPLDSVQWVAPEERPKIQPRCLFDKVPPLGDMYGEVTRRYSKLVDERTAGAEYADTHQVASGETAVFPTALCVEPRDGRLHIFLPPMAYLEHYLDLIASIEATARVTKLPVILEGYNPPRDWRMEQLMVTPDPGVIEVNIHPANNWDEIVRNTTTLYEHAHFSRLGTEKFMLDGRHVGTGGGNHVTIGGATASDSPMLRRPDVLRSFITYWQHHPGLSYLFSGMFIGPTSQAPRVDEGRHETLYELEIAFQEMPDKDQHTPFWMVDRLLRNLLVDITGNTHRAEFCIDKLFSPDSSTGRLGIVELRAFDMPPHARMSCVQMLLVRSLLAWFWQTPYEKPLVRWGTQLHDRFMLPHYVHRDVADVVGDLNRAGFPFQLDWFDPFLEFRFPHYGRVIIRDMEVELRMAIEPWHVLGEEVTGQGTARYVDSSVERVQVRVKGMIDSRYVLTCNGRRVPLCNTGTQGEYVAGIRYRAWQPPSALHPTIAPHAPIVLDIIDTWSGHSVGGCTYHVAHPGGLSYETFPVNAYEAESRRISRFWGYGHTPGQVSAQGGMVQLADYAPNGRIETREPLRESIDPEHPYTLDLRRKPQQ